MPTQRRIYYKNSSFRAEIASKVPQINYKMCQISYKLMILVKSVVVFLHLINNNKNEQAVYHILSA
jgi:hypothetical protein